MRGRNTSQRDADVPRLGGTPRTPDFSRRLRWLWPVALLVGNLAGQALSPAELKAFHRKEHGDPEGALRAFAAMAASPGSTAQDAALAEFHATMAAALAESLGRWDVLEPALGRALATDAARQHPALADRLRMLGLQAALARGRVSLAIQRTRESGLVTDWWIVGPFDNERGAGLARTFGPERGFDPERVYEGAKRPVRWRRLPVRAAPGGRVDLDHLVEPDDQVACYLATALVADTDRNVTLHLGSDEAFAVFLNGERRASRDVRRRFHYDQDAVPLPLRAGPNLLLLKICDEDGPYVVAARLSAPGGGPALGVSVDASVATMTAAAATRPRTVPGHTAFQGARSFFAERAEHDPAAALRLGYLLALYGADDPAEDRARRLAERVVAGLTDAQAAAVPASTARLLLAFTRIRHGATAAEKDENARRHNYLAVLKQDPSNVQALVNLAEMDLTGPHLVARAEARLRRALEIAPGFAHARLLLAAALDELGLRPLGDRERLRAAESGWPVALMGAAEVAERRREPERALELRRRALDGAFSEQGALFLAKTLLRTGHETAARELLQRLRTWRPFAPGARRAMAALAEARGDYAAAIEILREQLEICPEDDTTLVDLARLQGLAGREDLQRDLLRRAIELNPNLERVRRRLEFLEANTRPFFEDFAKAGDAVLAADPGPPPDAARANDPYYYLLDQHIVRSHRNGTASRYRHFVLRVLNEEGARRLRGLRVPHHPGEQHARLLSVRVVGADGRTRHPRLSRASVKLPPMRPGDALDVEWRVDDLGPTYFGDYFGLQHSFVPDDGAPCRLAELVLLLDRDRTYRRQSANGAPEPEVRPGPDNTVAWLYAMRDVPRTEIEERMPDWTEREPLVRVTTYRNWDEFASWWWHLIRKQEEITPALRAKVEELTANRTTREEKIAAIYRFVTTVVRYTAWEFGVHGYKPYSTAVVFDRRHGDCKDKAILMNVMLRLAGIEAYPVLIRAQPLRSRDDLSLPLVEHFNHCISFLPDEGGDGGRFLDGTAVFHPPDTLPAMDCGARVLVVRGEHGQIRDVPWPDPARNRETRHVRVRLRANGDAAVELHLAPELQQAVDLRAALGSEPGKRREKVERLLAATFGKVRVRRLRASDPLDLDVPMRLEVAFDVEKFAARQPEGLVLRSAIGTRDLTRWATAERRRFPLLLGVPASERTTWVFVPPPGHHPADLPEPDRITTPFGSFTMTWNWREGELHVERELVLAAPRIEAADYAAFREFVARVRQADEHPVVLVRQETGR